MNPILAGFFASCLWSFGEKLIYQIPHRRSDRRQAEEQADFILEAFNQIKDEIQAVQDKLDEEPILESIGAKFIDNFHGNVEQLEITLSDFGENILEIMESLERLESESKKVVTGLEDLGRGQQDNRQILMRIYHAVVEPESSPDFDREAFVDQIAEIYRITGHEVQRNVAIGEDKIDMTADFPMPLGMPKQTAYVQCVQDHEVSRKEMDDFRKALSDEKRATGMIVSQHGFEAGALTLAGEHGIIALNYDQLVSQIIDFSTYRERCMRDYEQAGFEQGVPLKRLYVEQDIIEDGTRKEYPLSDYVEEWMANDTQNLLVILADFGIGKTSYTLKLASELAAKRKLGNTGITPVRIELKSYREALKYETMIINHLTEFKVPTTGYEAFDFLLRTGEVLLILDAFDEMQVQVNEEITRKNFDELYKAVAEKDKAKVILTCRTHYFREHPVVESLVYDIDAPEGFRTPAGTALYKHISCRQNCRICFLQPFDEEKIKEYLCNPFFKEGEATLEMLEENPGLRDLATRPVLLAMIAQSFREISKKGDMPSTAALYEVYIQKWIERDDARTNLTKQGKGGFAEALATRLWIENRERMHYSELRPMVEQHFKSRIRVPQDAEYAEHEVRTASFLTRDAEGNYGFAHKSFMEFFLARKFAGEIERNQMADFGRERITKEVAGFLTDMVTEESLLESIRNKTPEEVGYTGANVVFVLRTVKNDLSGVDFSDCVLSHADFSGDVFGLSDFSSPCSLAGADLSNAYMDNVQLSTYSVSSVTYSPDDKYIVVGGVVVVGGGGGGGVTILDASDFSIVKEIETKYYVRHVTYSPDDKYIVVVGGGGVTILDAASFEIVREMVFVQNNVKGMKMDGVKGLDPIYEDALRRAI